MWQDINMNLEKIALEVIERWKQKVSAYVEEIEKSTENSEDYKNHLRYQARDRLEFKYLGLMEFLQEVSDQNGKANEQDSSTKDSNEG